MPKLPRVTAKVFASNAAPDDIGQYGSALANDKVLTSDIAQIQALPAYEVGWRGAVISNRNYPTLQEMNGLQKTFSQQIAYILQEGIPEYDAGTTYYKGSIVKVLDTSGDTPAPQLYYSLTDDNIGNPVTDTVNWKLLPLGGGSGLITGQTVISDDPLTDAGLHLKDGSVLSASGVYGSFVTNYIANLYASSPERFVTEEQWQSEVAEYGYCNFYVYNEEAGTVRLPKASDPEKRYLISGSADLNIYSDGWVEASGYAEGSSGSVTFPIAYNTVPRLVTTPIGTINLNSNDDLTYSTTNVNDTGFSYNFAGSNGSANGCNWVARGYMAGTVPECPPKYSYIVVGTVTKTEIEVNIDNVITDLNGKADIDLSNSIPSQSFKDESVNWDAPDVSTRVSKTFPFTAPYDCYVYVYANAANSTALLIIDGQGVWRDARGNTYVERAGYVRCPKGAVVTGQNIHTVLIDACKGVNINA